MTKNHFIESVKEGDAAENLFIFEAERRGYFIERSTKYENINNHIDCWILKNHKRVSIDVKARKRLTRNNAKYSDDFIWIEFKNVAGKKGWINGDQDIIAFEVYNAFILVNRLELLDLLMRTINMDAPFVESPRYALYRLYQRKGRLDLITKIKKEDLFRVNHRVWYKKNY